MAAKRRVLRLNADLVDRVPPHDGEAGPLPFPEATEEDHAEAARLLHAAVKTPENVWVFAYGSLIWNTGFDHVERRTGIVSGWHRSFCLGWDEWFRGSPEKPGLMLSLDRGGRCRGIVYRLPPDAVLENLRRLARREMRTRLPAHRPRWVTVRTDKGPVQAIAFVINPKAGRYVTGLSLDQIADMLASAAGPRGSMADYLYRTVKHLDEAGIHDRHLWRLEAMVADRLEAMGRSEEAALLREAAS